jgi:hypothetical protein
MRTKKTILISQRYQFHNRTMSVLVGRRTSQKLTPSVSRDEDGAHDRDDELQAQLMHADSKENVSDLAEPTVPLIDVPSNVSPDSLMGKMPKADKVIKKDMLKKLASSYEWKPMQVVLTSVGLYLARPDEDLLRDLIPLYEIIETKRQSDIPQLRMKDAGKSLGDPKRQMQAKCEVQKNQTGPLGRQSSMVKIASLTEETLVADESEKYIIQIRTADGGYNSGRTYHFSAGTDEECQEWVQKIRTASNKAILLRQAGPGIMEKAKYRLRQAYHSVLVQSSVAILIFLSFLSNIMQSELGGNGDSPYDKLFDNLEFLFTVLFTVELCVNMLAHYFWPFFKVGRGLLELTLAASRRLGRLLHPFPFCHFPPPFHKFPPSHL